MKDFKICELFELDDEFVKQVSEQEILVDLCKDLEQWFKDDVECCQISNCCDVFVVVLVEQLEVELLEVLI